MILLLERKEMIREAPWNRCDYCGKFISYKDFENESAMRSLIFSDSYLTEETWDTLCKSCWKKEKEKNKHEKD